MLPEGCELIRGDALRVLEDLPECSVDLILADPPYSSGGLFRGDRTVRTGSKYVSTGSSRQAIADFDGDTRDQRSYLAWSTLWLSEAWRTLRPGRACAVFTDWRQLPTTTDAIQAAGFVWRGICVWDKIGGRPLLGIANGQAEYIVWGTRGRLDLGHDIYLPNIIRAGIGHGERELHQTPKPVELLAQLTMLAPADGLIVDPFAGSGSTLIAARRTGRRVLGVELNPGHLETATQRLVRDGRQLELDVKAAG